MWEQKILSLSTAAEGVMCSVLSVTPWTWGAGQKEGADFYLSPGNAVEWVVARMAGVRPGADVTAWMITAPTLAEFIQTLARINGVFPLPEISTLYRRASTAAGLSVSRMQIPASPGGLPAVRPLSVSTLRGAASAELTANAGQGGQASLSGLLARFQQQREDILSEAREDLTGAQGRSVPVYAVSSIRDVASAVKQMRESVPCPDHVFALCLVFIGSDLSAIREMMHDPFTA